MDHITAGTKDFGEEIKRLNAQIRELTAAKKLVEASLSDYQTKAKEKEDRVSGNSFFLSFLFVAITVFLFISKPL